ncbi:MAG: hypothetical protein QXD77_03505 [Candidatus Aenigmatarchaeota archaeon]
MALAFASELQAFGLTDIILWMITFAVVYGVLSQVGDKGAPQHKGSRGIIAIVVAFMVLFAAPAQLSAMIAKLSSSLLLIVLGLLSLIVFIEAAGVKVHPMETVEGRKVIAGKEISIFDAYGKYFGIALIFIVIMIFVTAGGLNWIGLGNIGGAFGQVNVLGAGLFIMIILAILWMIAESGGEEKK